VNWSEYRALDAVNWSSLKWMATSPAHYKYHLTHARPDTPAMALGRAVHTAVLEPDEFPLRYTVWHASRRTNEYRAFMEAAEINGQEVLTPDEYAKCLAIRDAVESHAVAGPLLCGGDAEVTVTWTDAATGINCKGRADYIRGVQLVDLKTTRSLDPRDFQRTYHALGYYGQLAFYLRGLAANGAVAPECYLVAVESEPPHDVAAFRPTEDALYAGDVEVAELLARLKSCIERDEWPGRYPNETELDLPSWYYAQADAVMEASL
jgi:hypothetical protein